MLINMISYIFVEESALGLVVYEEMIEYIRSVNIELEGRKTKVLIIKKILLYLHCPL